MRELLFKLSARRGRALKRTAASRGLCPVTVGLDLKKGSAKALDDGTHQGRDRWRTRRPPTTPGISGTPLRFHWVGPVFRERRAQPNRERIQESSSDRVLV